MNNKKRHIVFLPVMLLLILFTCFLPAAKASAEDAAVITIGKIDYENLTIQVFNNNNTIVYYSTDQTSWNEVEGAYSSLTKSFNMDISWVSSTSDTTLYFKGDTIKTIKSLTLPRKNSSIKVSFDKIEGELIFTDVEEADVFQWRKVTDYNWITVSLEEASSSYNTFLDTVELMRSKGVKIYIRTPQEEGTGINNVGIRPSKEVMVTITARVSAPSININSSKLIVSTSSTMEYFDARTSLWVDCTGAMEIEDIAPSALYQNGAKTVSLMIRKMATKSDSFSKTANIIIPGQSAAPLIGDNTKEVTYYYMNSKLILQFGKASISNIYEYAIIRSGATFNRTSASWKTVTNSKQMTLTKTTAPEGCTIYVRRKGTDANSVKGLKLVLSSELNNFIVKY